jgi:hypothetical protein
MKKYYVFFDDLCDEKPVAQPGFTDHEVYLASEVDPRIAELEQCGKECSEGFRRMQERIDALERALRSSTLALIKKRAADAQWSQTVDAAVAEANDVLGSPTS